MVAVGGVSETVLGKHAKEDTLKNYLRLRALETRARKVSSAFASGSRKVNEEPDGQAIAAPYELNAAIT